MTLGGAVPNAPAAPVIGSHAVTDALAVAAWRAAAVSAGADLPRRSILFSTTALPALVPVPGLRGLTFAPPHLAAMRLTGLGIPGRLSATARSVCGNVARGVASAASSLVSRALYAGLGTDAF